MGLEQRILHQKFSWGSHGGRGLGSKCGGDDEIRRRDGDHPGLKGDEDLEGNSNVGRGKKVSSACHGAPFGAIEIMATFLWNT